MKLLTKEARDRLPPVGSTDMKDSEVFLKFFTPVSNWTWWVFEGEPVLDEQGREVDFVFFGLVRGFETEIGSFVLSELSGTIRGLRLVERDLHFQPTTKVELLRSKGMSYLADSIEGEAK